ncbi:MAG: Mu transposase C-terminal domain-containing protein [Deferrisomatales bacterium]|nr:Mu transposase C-terminal domain-containing protein [Deferrisomatales bacterium]
MESFQTSIDTWVEATVLADVWDVSERHARRRATGETVATKTVCVGGRKQKHYLLSSFPDKDRLRIAAYLATREIPKLLADPAAQAGADFARQLLQDEAHDTELRRIDKERGLARFESLPEKHRQRALANSHVLRAWRRYLDASGAVPKGQKKQATEIFCSQIAAGSILPYWVLKELTRSGKPSLTYEKLNRLEKIYQKEGILGLAPKYKSPHKGETTVPKPMQDFLIGLMAKRPHVKPVTLMQGLQGRFRTEQLPTFSSVRRFVGAWKEQNASLFLFLSNPDRWKNQHMFAVGQADENITRLNQVWELDSTPSDILLEDGRYALIGVIDVYSRRGKLHVVPTSKATSIAALARRAILDWGVPETAKTDNGQDYVSNHLVQVFEDLEIRQSLCPPFTPEGKPHIERFFRTFAHGLLEMMPGFIGHNVAERKAIEAQKSFAQRMMTKDSAVELHCTRDALQQFCDRWCRAEYEQAPHGGLKGQTPAEVARAWTDPVRRVEDERSLDVLLCETVHRTVGKKGVAHDNRHYAAPEMAGHEGKRVRVKPDPTDLGRVYVHKADGEFLCVAIDPSAPEVDRAEFAARVKTAQTLFMNEGRKALSRMAKEQALETVTEEYLSCKEGLLNNLEEFPKPFEVHTTPALEEAVKAADARAGLSPDAFAAITVSMSDVEPPAPPPIGGPAEVVELPRFFAGPFDLYEHCRDLSRCGPLPKELARRLKVEFEQSSNLRQLMEIERTLDLVAEA